MHCLPRRITLTERDALRHDASVIQLAAELDIGQVCLNCFMRNIFSLTATDLI